MPVLPRLVFVLLPKIFHRFWLNDLNQPLIELLKLVIESPEQITEIYTHLSSEQDSDSISHYGVAVTIMVKYTED
ncbi:DNA adenine methylase [Roseofilum capinflatum]|uniref:DNA adenine methylase n=1 Tax=Roseofilum capinflatum BLCC-M114 TaxID=3022440 RepID=A0ABT7BB51_9CYAN|nr:DNA adenine methylase [Roseofilum capinflatum]MDJ1176047.1 DNA adenine methylase [Roseofilum capinflatum BLCC-M114]